MSAAKRDPFEQRTPSQEIADALQELSADALPASIVDRMHELGSNCERSDVEQAELIRYIDIREFQLLIRFDALAALKTLRELESAPTTETELQAAIEEGIAALDRLLEMDWPADVKERMHELGENKDFNNSPRHQEYGRLVDFWELNTLQRCRALVAMKRVGRDISRYLNRSSASDSGK